MTVNGNGFDSYSNNPGSTPGGLIRITPEIIARLVEESQQLRAEYRKRLKRMWHIPVEQRLTPSD